MIVHIVNTNTVAKKCALSVLKIYMKNYLPKYDCNHNVLSKSSGTVASKIGYKCAWSAGKSSRSYAPEGKPTDVIIYPKAMLSERQRI